MFHQTTIRHFQEDSIFILTVLQILDPTKLLLYKARVRKIIHISHCIETYLTGYELDFDSRLGRFCSHLQLIQIESAVHPSSWPKGTGDYFPGGNEVRAWSWPVTSIDARIQAWLFVALKERELQGCDVTIFWPELNCGFFDISHIGPLHFKYK
jgi:hypothetical protein